MTKDDLIDTSVNLRTLITNDALSIRVTKSQQPLESIKKNLSYNGY